MPVLLSPEPEEVVTFITHMRKIVSMEFLMLLQVLGIICDVLIVGTLPFLVFMHF